MLIRSIALRCLGSVLAAALLSCAPGAAFAQFTISRFTIDGGGGTSSVGGTFALGGTIGQPDAGRLSGASFTLSGGFWAGGAAVTAVGDDAPGDGPHLPNAAPLAFRMYPATPNPLSERTLVAFDLPATALVRAALFDASGRLVRTLADESLPGGKHQCAWDRRDASGRAVASGIYFLRLEAGAHQATQTVVVVR
jgi:FlgD Ig-like domain